jgi:hypothetical protein
MSLSAITQANGADLLNLYAQSTGQAPTNTAVSASEQALQEALAVARLSASEILSGDSAEAGQLNVFA